MPLMNKLNKIGAYVIFEGHMKLHILRTITSIIDILLSIYIYIYNFMEELVFNH